MKRVYLGKRLKYLQLRMTINRNMKRMALESTVQRLEKLNSPGKITLKDILYRVHTDDNMKHMRGLIMMSFMNPKRDDVPDLEYSCDICGQQEPICSLPHRNFLSAWLCSHCDSIFENRYNDPYRHPDDPKHKMSQELKEVAFLAEILSSHSQTNRKILAARHENIPDRSFSEITKYHLRKEELFNKLDALIQEAAREASVRVQLEMDAIRKAYEEARTPAGIERTKQQRIAEQRTRGLATYQENIKKSLPYKPGYSIDDINKIRERNRKEKTLSHRKVSHGKGEYH